jgi:3-phenylpropionate/cinnamic acid dioxygenase small subunit
MTGRPVSTDEHLEVAGFVYAESRLLDEHRFDDWLLLFADDGVYWVPASPGQNASHDALSLYHERKSVLAIRVARLAEASLHAAQPMVRTHHHCTAVEIAHSSMAGVDYEVNASLVVAEWRNEEGRWFAGRTRFHLRRSDGQLKIVLKRVDLINCDAPHRALVVPF